MSLQTSLRTLARTYSQAIVPDAELLARFAERRDDESFRSLVERHGPMVKAVCRRTSGDEHAAEDAFQAAFLTLARQAGRIRRPEALPGWLYKVAHSCGLKARRKRPALPANERLDSSVNPLDRISGRELLVIVDAELVRLPESHRSAIIVCTIEGLTVEEAAKRLKTTTGAVRGWLERGREMLRKRLAARKIELSAVLVALSAASSCRLTAGQVESVVAVVNQSASLIPSALSAFATPRAFAGWSVLAATVALGTIAGMNFAEPKKTEIATPEPKREVVYDPIPKRKDDEPPLPAGAVARFGSTKMRADGASKWKGFTRDGKYLLSMAIQYSENIPIDVWSMETGKKVRTISYGQMQEGAHILPDGKTALIFVTDNGDNPDLGCPPGLPKMSEKHGQHVVHRVNIETGTIQSSARLCRPGPTFLDYDHCISHDGLLIAGSDERTNNKGKHGIHIYSTVNGEIVTQIKDWMNADFSITAMAFLPDSKQIAFAIVDGTNKEKPKTTIHFHDVKTGQLKRSIPTVGQSVNDITFSSNGERMGYTIRSKNGTETIVYDLKSNHEIMAASYHRQNFLYGAYLTPDGQTVVSQLPESSIVYDVKNAKERFRLPNSVNSHGQRPVISADGEWVALSNWGPIGVWNLKTGELHPHSANPFDTEVKARFTKTGSFRVLSDRITERDLNTGKQTERSWPCQGARNGAEDEISDDGSFAAIEWDTRDGKKETAGDVRIRLLDIEKNNFVSECAFKTMRTFGTCFSRDNRYYYVSHGDDVRLKKTNVQRIDVKTGRVDRTYEGHNDAMYVLKVSPDGRYLAGANPYSKDDGVDYVRIWDAESGKLLHEVSLKSAVTEFRIRRGLLVDGTHYHIGNLTFLPDGQLVAEIAADQDLVFLDPQSGKELNRLPFDERRIDQYTFDHEGKKLFFREHRKGDKQTDYSIKVRNLKSGLETTLIKGQHARIEAPIVVSGNGKWLGTVSEQGLCYLWDVAKLENAKPKQE